MCLRTVASVSGRLLLSHLCAANFSICILFLCSWVSLSLPLLTVFCSPDSSVCFFQTLFMFWQPASADFAFEGFWTQDYTSCPHILIICLTKSVQQQTWLLLKSSVIFFYIHGQGKECWRGLTLCFSNVFIYSELYSPSHQINHSHLFPTSIFGFSVLYKCHIVYVRCFKDKL